MPIKTFTIFICDVNRRSFYWQFKLIEALVSKLAALIKIIPTIFINSKNEFHLTWAIFQIQYSNVVWLIIRNKMPYIKYLKQCEYEKHEKLKRILKLSDDILIAWLNEKIVENPLKCVWTQQGPIKPEEISFTLQISTWISLIINFQMTSDSKA